MDEKFESEILNETKKDKLRSFVVFACFVILIFWATYSFINVLPVIKSSYDYDNISKYVEENTDELMKFIYKYKESADTKLPEKIQSVNICDLGNGDFGIQFFVGGWLDNTNGFIYSSNGQPFTESCETDNIVKSEDNMLRWDKYSHHETFRYIKDNFYFWKIDS